MIVKCAGPSELHGYIVSDFEASVPSTKVMKGWFNRDEEGKVIIDTNGFVTITCEGKQWITLDCTIRI